MSLEFQNLESSITSLSKKRSLLAIKSEFEAEGTRISELSTLTYLCIKHNIPLSIKIGGPLAFRDIYESFQLGVDNIIVPMIESSFSLSKAAEAYLEIRKTFANILKAPKLLINIETKEAFSRLNSIIDTIIDEKLPIHTIVIGRHDLSSSLNIKNVNHYIVSGICHRAFNKIKSNSLKCTIGGDMSINSFDIINELSSKGLDSFETRQCSFNASKEISKEDFSEALKLAYEYEIAWLNYKKSNYLSKSVENDCRIKLISNRNFELSSN